MNCQQMEPINTELVLLIYIRKWFTKLAFLFFTFAIIVTLNPVNPRK
jgi:hypothetical protein